MHRRPFSEAFRTKPCKFFENGTCKNGDTCRFIHLQPASEKWKEAAQYQGKHIYVPHKEATAGGGAPPANPTPTFCSSCARQYVGQVKGDPRDNIWWQHFRRVHVEKTQDGPLDQAAEDRFWRIFNQLPLMVYTSLTWANETEYDVFLRLKGAKN